jgi:hypothetical protein
MVKLTYKIGCAKSGKLASGVPIPSLTSRRHRYKAEVQSMLYTSSCNVSPRCALTWKICLAVSSHTFMSSWISITPSSGTRTVIDDPPEAGEEFLQYVFDRLEVRLWCKPARMRRAVPSSEVFNEHVIRDLAVLL